MSVRTRLIFSIGVLLPVVVLAQTLDPSSSTLTAAAAEKFVRATQQMVSSGAPPQIQGGPKRRLLKQ